MDENIFKVPAYGNDLLQKEVLDHLNQLTKPPGSLGRLEEFALRYCLCRGKVDAEISRMKIFTFAGDHGITKERITPYPSEVTYQMVLNMVNGGAAVSVMCKKAGIDCEVVDIGVAGSFKESPGLLIHKVGPGTKNFLHEPAITEAQCNEAIQIGFDLALQSNSDLLGVGEMGIGNTSSASALYSLLLEVDPEETVGPGTGSSGPLLDRKKQVIKQALLVHRAEWDGTPLGALWRVGGYEIAGMAGAIFGSASRHVPVVIDGFVSSAAALIAIRLNPEVRKYLFFSHASDEKYHVNFLERERIRPILSLDMRLGEGTGSVLAMQIIAQAMECYNRMATFESAGVSGKDR